MSKAPLKGTLLKGPRFLFSFLQLRLIIMFCSNYMKHLFLFLLGTLSAKAEKSHAVFLLLFASERWCFVRLGPTAADGCFDGRARYCLRLR